MPTVDYTEIEQRMRDSIDDYDEKLAVEKVKLELELQLHALRQAAGKTQQELADALDVARPQLSRLESAGYNPTLSTLVEYVHALGYRLSIEAVDTTGGTETRIPLLKEPA